MGIWLAVRFETTSNHGRNKRSVGNGRVFKNPFSYMLQSVARVCVLVDVFCSSGEHGPNPRFDYFKRVGVLSQSFPTGVKRSFVDLSVFVLKPFLVVIAKTV